MLITFAIPLKWDNHVKMVKKDCEKQNVKYLHINITSLIVAISCTYTDYNSK